MLELEFSQISDTGPVRPHNEDYIGCVEPENAEEASARGWLFVLADGVGGHAQGEVASKAAVESVLEGFRTAGRGESLSKLLPRLVQRANARVFQVAIDAGPDGAGMSTTIVSCAIRHDRVCVAHVGDSRCYLIRGGEMRVLTRDHTVANEQARVGILTASEASEAESRHVLSRSLGSEMMVNVEVDNHQVFPGDVLLLCSDGLHGAISGAELVETVNQAADLAAAGRRLVELANSRDGGDNVSAQLVRVRSVERVGMYRGRPYKLR